MKAIINGQIVTPTKILSGYNVIIEDDLITAIETFVPEDAHIIDAGGLIVSPGFVDVHIHGSMGFDVMDANAAAILEIAKGIAQNGTTSFLPTTMTMAKANIFDSLLAIRQSITASNSGAQILGAHLEGPFINAKFKGAQNETFIVKPDYEWIREFDDIIKLITYAPEMDDSLAFTKKVKANTDITLSIGHSDATFEQAKEAISCGCSHVTHLFNGMPPLHHRNPGIIGAALTSDVFTELIADNVHVDKNLYQFVLNNKGSEKIVLITDSMRAGCMKDGVYDLGGQSATVIEGVARLANGTLAGSVLTLNQAVKHFYESTDATLEEAINFASLNPATTIKLQHKKGSIEVGKDADIIFLDNDFNCHFTMIGGEIVYEIP